MSEVGSHMRDNRESYEMQVIARVQTPFEGKFGIPRQPGLIPEVDGRIVFEPAWRKPEALRGIDGFSHLWLIWCFSEHVGKAAHPTVRPPRLDGNSRMGVFATRSPFRPNPLGLSLVTLDGVDWETADGPVLRVSGLDLLDGTPLLDIKPYIPFADSRPDARTGFVETADWPRLEVRVSDDLLELIPRAHRAALREVLAQDPRPAYQHDPDRIYGLSFGGRNIRFTVKDGVATVIEISELPNK